MRTVSVIIPAMNEEEPIGPLVERVRAILDNDPIDKRAVSKPHPRIGDDVNGEPVALSQTYDLVFDGAGIGIDVNLHGRALGLNQRMGPS